MDNRHKTTIRISEKMSQYLAENDLKPKELLMRGYYSHLFNVDAREIKKIKEDITFLRKELFNIMLKISNKVENTDLKNKTERN